MIKKYELYKVYDPIKIPVLIDASLRFYIFVVVSLSYEFYDNSIFEFIPVNQVIEYINSKKADYLKNTFKDVSASLINDGENKCMGRLLWFIFKTNKKNL